jgi:hypothetical protein
VCLSCHYPSFLRSSLRLLLCLLPFLYFSTLCCFYGNVRGMNLKELCAPLQSVLVCSKYSSCDLDQETKTTHMRYLYQWAFDVSGCSCLPQVQDVKHFKRVCLHCVQLLAHIARVRHRLLFCSLALSLNCLLRMAL